MAALFPPCGISGAGASRIRIMIGVYREFEGCMRLMGHVLRRLRVLALPPVTESLTRQIYFTGASATAAAAGDKATAEAAGDMAKEAGKEAEKAGDAAAKAGDKAKDAAH